MFFGSSLRILGLFGPSGRSLTENGGKGFSSVFQALTEIRIISSLIDTAPFSRRRSYLFTTGDK